MSDGLRELLDVVRAEVPGMGTAELTRVEQRLRLIFGGERIWVARQPKRRLLELLADIPADARTADELQRRLGISRAHAFRLLKLLT